MIGSSIGHYEITAKLGQGGMGEVFRARDTRLNREVAIKVLPVEFAADEQRMGRFRREAQVLASLNHPNIAAIYGLESREAGSGTTATSCLVMELVEGEDLSERIARGPVPLDEALPIALQIAEALADAHEKGIIHRDLKPANIKLTPEGRVKILDFGLAKALAEPELGLDSPRHDSSHSPTLSLAATQAGIILGTAAYMSPEQARGKPVDRRTDIWAFGVVVFEMLCGRKAFEGEDIALTLAAVVKEEPDWSLLPQEGQPYRQILTRCLTKDARERYHHITDVRIAIEDRLGNRAERVGDRPPAQSGWRKLIFAAAVPVIALVASLITWSLIPQQESRRVHSSVLPPDQAQFDPNGGPIAPSPDGSLLAYVARTAEGKRMLWVRPLGSGSAQPLQGTEGAIAPFWSPDSRSIGFFADGRLKRINTTGESLEALGSYSEISLGTWNQDGTILFTPYWGGGIHRVSSTGEGSVPFTEPDRNAGEHSHNWPSFLPDGNHFLYSATSVSGESNRVFVSSLDGMAPQFLMNATSNVLYVAPGYLLFWRDGAIRGQRFDPESLKLEGAPVTVATGVRFDTSLGGLFGASQNGVLAYLPGSQSRLSRLLWFDRSGRQLEAVGGAENHYFPRISHEGSQIVVDVSNLQDMGDLWLYGISRPVPSRFTFDPANDTRPAWSPDDSSIVFSSPRGESSKSDVYLKPTGGGQAEFLFSDAVRADPTDWSPDGRFILYERAVGSQNVDLWSYDVHEKKMAPVLESPFMETDGQFSSDGRWVAYVSDELGQREVYVGPFPGPGVQLRISPSGGSMPRWSADGRELFFIAPDRTLMKVDIRLDGEPVIEAPQSLFATQIKHGSTMPTNYDVSRDGQRFLINSVIEEGESQPITLMVNWAEGLDITASRSN
ncbi:MAG: serine/threonine-protein kinase [Acidobacteriota bacterium]|nr:MAG: serine/threonine-protein kinase [Acidobacteriota bacterium]